MADPIKLTVDGREIEAQPGQTIIQAAQDAGLYIPYLCYYPGMKPYGSCRMCLVETEAGGRKGIQASCTTPAAPDMVVRTNTGQVQELRRGITDLLMTEHPHGCLTCHRIELCGPQDICQRHVGVTDRCTICPKNERCELKDTVRSMRLDMTTPLNYHRRGLPIHTDDPFYDRDYNLCIVCARCVRVCDEVRGNTVLALTERSGVSLVGTSHGTSLLESGCEFCGGCVNVCPTGALVEREYKWEKAVATVKTVCRNCPVGCQFVMQVNDRNKVIRMTGDLAGAAARGQACFKGKYGYDYPNQTRRLKYPMVRVDGELRRTTWEQALAAAAEGIGRHLPEERGVIASPRGTNEDMYVAGKFARMALGANNVDSGLNVVPELTGALRDRLGYGAATNPVWDIENSNCVMVVSGNPTEEQNVLAVPVKRAARRGADLVVVDARETELTRYATHWLRPRPGTEVTLIGGMVKVVLDEALENKDFVRDRLEGLDGLKREAWSFDLLRVAEITGVDQDEIRAAARTYARSAPASLLYGCDSVPEGDRSDLVAAVVNLALVTGNIGREGGGLFPLYSGGNTQGAADVGCAPGLLPGFRSVDSAADRAALEAAWAGRIPTAQGMGVRGMIEGVGSGRIKALVVMADGLDTDAAGLTRAGLPKPEFLVVSDVFLSDTAAQADVVFPAATYAEVTGTLTNLERRVSLSRAGLDLRNEERGGWATLSALAAAMGVSGFDYESSSAVFAEIAQAVPAYAGLSHDRLAAGGVQWPAPSADEPGTEVLYEAGDDAPKLSVGSVTIGGPAAAPEGEYPFVLAHGRVLQRPEEDLKVVRDGAMNRIEKDAFIEIHPEDAGALGIVEGDAVAISVREDTAASGIPETAIARLTSPLRGLASITTLFADLAVAMQNSEAPDWSPSVRGLPLRQASLAKAPARREAGALAD